MAKLRLVYSPAAVRDVQDVYVYIASDSLKHSVKTIDRITRLCEDLADSPGMGHRRVDLDQEPFEILCITQGSYCIFYVVIEDELKIVRILHGARDVTLDHFKDSAPP